MSATDVLATDFAGKTALVTGASRGIGRAVAERLAADGARVVVTSTGDAPEWCAATEGCEHSTLDLLERGGVETFLAGLADVGDIDILVNNAGIHRPEPIDEIDPAHWDELVRVNLAGPMRLMRAITPGMRDRGAGKVLNVASIAAFVSRPGSAAYAATKAALVGLTRAAALDMAPHEVLVNALCPGYTMTDMAKNVLTDEQRAALVARVPLGRFAEPAELAEMAAFLVSDLNTYITGQTIVVDGGVTAQ